MPETIIIDDEPDDLPAPERGFEFYNNELREMPGSMESIRIAGEICYVLMQYARSHPILVFSGGLSYRCFPQDRTRLRRASTSVITHARLPVETYRAETHCSTVPDLVVEVISPNDSALEVEEKIDQWLEAGVKMVWEVIPNTKAVLVRAARQPILELRGSDLLVADKILPGFSCPVEALFQRVHINPSPNAS